MSSTPFVIAQPQARQLLEQLDVPQILRKMFRDLAADHAVQPAQQQVEFPRAPGTSSTISGSWPKTGSMGSRPPLYRSRRRPLVTAWTLLMSMDSGQPLLLCDAGN